MSSDESGPVRSADELRAPGSNRARFASRWLAFALLLLGFSGLPAHAGTVEVIVNPAQSTVIIDRALLRAIFSLRLRQWPSGAPIRVFVLPDDDPVSGDFCRNKLGTYPYVLRAAWDRSVFTGTGLAPTLVRSEKEMRERVSSTPGAIGYVSGGSSRLSQPLPDLLMAASSPRPRSDLRPSHTNAGKGGM